MSNAVTRGAIRRFFYTRIWRRLKLAWLVIRAYLFNNIVVVDYQINALLGGAPGETISSRLGKGQRKGQPVHCFFARVVDAIFRALFNEKRHCRASIQHDEGHGAISEVIERYKAGEKNLWQL